MHLVVLFASVGH